jgi:hypothetical protein
VDQGCPDNVVYDPDSTSDITQVGPRRLLWCDDDVVLGETFRQQLRHHTAVSNVASVV